MKTVKQLNAINKLVVVLGELVFVGVDVHKLTYHVALWSRERGLLTSWVQPADAQVLEKHLSRIEPALLRIVYEAGPTGFGLARYFLARGVSIKVIAPSQIPVLPGRQTKTDGLDCRKLAVYESKGLLQKINIPTEEEEADRQIVRHREQLIRKRRRCMQQIKSLLLQHSIAEPVGLKDWSAYALVALRELELPAEIGFCLHSLLDELEWQNRQVRKVTAQIKTLAQSERHRQASEHLCSIPGVGLITAMTFRTEFPRPERFHKETQIARIIGLAPSVWQTGKTRRTGPIMKSGNARVRAVLVEAAWRWIRTDDGARKKFARLMGNTANSKKAIVGMARRLAICMWRISSRQTPYRKMAA